MDSEGWLELTALVLGLALLALLVAAEEVLARVSPGRAPDPGWTDPEAPGGASVDWLRQRHRQTRLSLLLLKSLALVGSTSVLVSLLLRLVSPRGWAIALAVAVILILVLLLQLALRYQATRHPRGTAVALAGPLRALTLVTSPVTWALLTLLDRLGIDSPSLDTGHLPGAATEPPGEPEQRMIRGIIGLGQTTVREIMVPRLDMVAVEESTPLTEVVSLVKEQGFSRLPVYRDTIDHVVGVVHVKDILPLLSASRTPTLRSEDREPAPALSPVARTPYFIPDSKKVDECLEDFQHHQVQMAIVVDEYGGVVGLVTMEDLLEEIVGEIGDEYYREEPRIQPLDEAEALVDGRVSIADVNEALGLNLPSEGFDTIGGLVLSHLGYIPSPGEVVEAYGVRVSVVTTLGRRIKQVRLVKLLADTAADQ